jgi:hypothetical protein
MLHVIRAGYVGAPATHGVIDSIVVCERDRRNLRLIVLKKKTKKKEKIWMNVLDE